MKVKKLVSTKNCIAALVVGLAVSQAPVAARDAADARVDQNAESCPTVRPGPDWTCAHGGWWPLGMAIPGFPRYRHHRRRPTWNAASEVFGK